MDALDKIKAMRGDAKLSPKVAMCLAREMHDLPDDRLKEAWRELTVSKALEGSELLLTLHPYIEVLMVNLASGLPRPTWEETLSGKDPAAGQTVE